MFLTSSFLSRPNGRQTSFLQLSPYKDGKGGPHQSSQKPGHVAARLLKCSFVDILLKQGKRGGATVRVQGVDLKQEGAFHKPKERRTKELAGKTYRGKIKGTRYNHNQSPKALIKMQQFL